MRTTIRQEVVNFVNADFVSAFPAVPIHYDNQPFETNSPQDLFVTLEIRPYAGFQISMSATPKTRIKGFIYVTCYSKTGSGTVPSLQILDWMETKLGYKNLGITQIEAPSPVEGEILKGWHTEGVKFAFYADKP